MNWKTRLELGDAFSIFFCSTQQKDTNISLAQIHLHVIHKVVKNEQDKTLLGCQEIGAQSLHTGKHPHSPCSTCHNIFSYDRNIHLFSNNIIITRLHSPPHVYHQSPSVSAFTAGERHLLNSNWQKLRIQNPNCVQKCMRSFSVVESALHFFQAEPGGTQTRR